MTENPMTDALSKGTFSVLDVVKGRGYPQDIVDIYTDHETAFKIHRLEQQIGREKDAEKVNELDAQKRELAAKVKESVLTFHLRGIDQGVIDAVSVQGIEKFKGKEDDPFRGRWTDASYLAHHIVSVTNANGDVDRHSWTVDEVLSLWETLPGESFAKLLVLMQELTFAARYFDEAVSADF